jgi:hypothetical protein
MSDDAYYLVFYRGFLHNMEFTSAVYRLKVRPGDGLPRRADIKSQIISAIGATNIVIDITCITPVTRREWDSFLEGDVTPVTLPSPTSAATINPACILM